MEVAIRSVQGVPHRVWKRCCRITEEQHLTQDTGGWKGCHEETVFELRLEHHQVRQRRSEGTEDARQWGHTRRTI